MQSKNVQWPSMVWSVWYKMDYCKQYDEAIEMYGYQYIIIVTQVCLDLYTVYFRL